MASGLMAQPTEKSTMAYGLLAAALGFFVMLQTAGVLGAAGRAAGQSPSWIGICAGLVFVAGGIAVVIQSLPAAMPRPDGGLSPDAPPWVHRIVLALCLMVTGGLAAIALWVAFGAGPRPIRATFIASGWIDGTLGRAIFGLGAVLTCVILVAFAIDATHRLTGRK
jgi:hypothetical protein